MTDRPLSFTVEGLPQPKGSTQSFGRALEGPAGPLRNRQGRIVVRTSTTSDNPHVKAWQSLVGKTAWVAKQTQWPKGERAHTLTGPVELTVGFFLRAPLKATAGAAHVTKPDLDKLLRAILDALTDVVWLDDAQVTAIYSRKSYADPQTGPRAVITVRPVPAPLFAALGPADAPEP